MRHYVAIDLHLPPADRAVKYLLDRMQVDADLAAQIGPKTVAFNLLIDAEAERLHEPSAQVAALRCFDLRQHLEPAEVDTLRAEVKRLTAILEA